jgi:hypothetical protein
MQDVINDLDIKLIEDDLITNYDDTSNLNENNDIFFASEIK